MFVYTLFLLPGYLQVGGNEDHVASTHAQVAAQYGNVDRPLAKSAHDNVTDLGVGEVPVGLVGEVSLNVSLHLQHELHGVHTAATKCCCCCC